MSGNIDRRLEKLEVILRPIGCDFCRGFIGVNVVDTFGNSLQPEDCPRCGRHIPVLQTVELTGIRLEDI
jgi:hypothetical protein